MGEEKVFADTFRISIGEIVKILFRIYEPRKEGIRKYLCSEFDSFRKFNWDKPFWLDFESEVFSIFIGATSQTHHVQLDSTMKFSQNELSQVKLYSVGSNKFVPESDGAYRKMREYTDAIPLRDSLGGYKVRLLDTLYLGKRSYPLEFVGVLESASEFLIGSSVKDFLEQFGDVGIQFKQVHYYKTVSVIPGAYLLFCDRFLPPLMVDQSFFSVNDHGHDVYKILGVQSLSYSKLKRGEKIFRGAEPTSASGTPGFYFREEIVDSIRKNNVRGWSFAPVLDADSELYTEYQKLWGRAFSKIRINSKNRIG